MGIDTFEIVAGESSATLAPARGGMATRFRVGARDVLYLDEATFLDPTKYVRGGNPVLFPSPGKLEGDVWRRGGKSGALTQHGFARSLGWTVESKSASDATLVLAATDETRAAYPWDFRATLRYAVQGKTLRVEQRVTNEGDGTMPFGFGFHPYFAVAQADKRTTRVATDATRAWDNVAKKEIALRRNVRGTGAASSTGESIDLTAKEVDLHLLDHGKTESSLGDIVVRGSPEYTHWVVWTLEGKDFVCLEPWTCPGNALNTGQRLIELGRGESRSLWIEIAIRA